MPKHSFTCHSRSVTRFPSPPSLAPAVTLIVVVVVLALTGISLTDAVSVTTQATTAVSALTALAACELACRSTRPAATPNR